MSFFVFLWKDSSIVRSLDRNVTIKIHGKKKIIITFMLVNLMDEN